MLFTGLFVTVPYIHVITINTLSIQTGNNRFFVHHLGTAKQAVNTTLTYYHLALD